MPVSSHLPYRRKLPTIPGTGVADLAPLAQERAAPNILIPGKQSYHSMTVEQRLASRRARVQAPIYEDARWQHEQLLKQPKMRVVNTTGREVTLRLNLLTWIISEGETSQPRSIALAFEQYKMNFERDQQLQRFGALDYDPRATGRKTELMRAEIERIANQETRL